MTGRSRFDNIFVGFESKRAIRFKVAVDEELLHVHTQRFVRHFKLAGSLRPRILQPFLSPYNR